MNNSRNRVNLLNKLRKDLKHFDESGHLGDDPNVIEIKNILFRRIAELEAALERTTEFAAATALEKASDDSSDNNSRSQTSIMT